MGTMSKAEKAAWLEECRGFAKVGAALETLSKMPDSHNMECGKTVQAFLIRSLGRSMVTPEDIADAFEAGAKVIRKMIAEGRA